MPGPTILSALLLAFSSAAIAEFRADANPQLAIFAFGDVLSDVGNNNALPDGFHANHPYYGVDFPGGVATGRFTNGYNMVDIIARHLGFEESPPAYFSPAKGSDAFSGVNFASGGSGILIPCTEGDLKRCYTMDEQIDFFKRTRAELPSLLGSEASCRHLISNSLFIVTAGGYDVNQFFTGQLATFGSTIDSFVANMTSTFRDHLKELYDLGARRFAITNVQPMGLSPEVDVLKPTMDVEDILNEYVRKFNDAEYAMLKELSSNQLPGMKYSVGNLYAALTDLIIHPGEHGMKNVTRPCCGEVHWSPTIPHIQGIFCSAEAPCCSNRSEYVYWDRLHPTHATIQYAGEKFYSGNLTYAKPINLKQLVTRESAGAVVVTGSLSSDIEAV